jgi:hypothetical protein
MIEEFDDVVSPIVAVHPPQQWLYTACGLVAAALLMALFGPLWMAIFGYLLASFGAVGLVAKFRWDDRLARRSPYYSPNQRLRSLQKWLRLVAKPIAEMALVALLGRELVATIAVRVVALLHAATIAMTAASQAPMPRQKAPHRNLHRLPKSFLLCTQPY